jgi:NAD(P)-dependent dehydrogenase (short-subunit alcohol dehydrogenase family)
VQQEGKGVLAGDVAIVTGGASGIGEGIVRAFVREGARVLVADVSQEAAERLAASFDGQVAAVRADLGVPGEAERMVQAAVSTFGRATILVHAAAPAYRHGPLLAMPEDAWMNVIQVILNGGYLAAKAFTEQVVRQNEADGAPTGGRIVNIVSTVVHSPRVDASAYCAAKTGLVALTRSLALELGQYGIRVMAVGPGLTRTPAMIGRNPESYNAAFLKQVPLARLGEVEDVAEAVLYVVSPVASYVSGQVLYVDGGYGAGKLSVQE